MNESGDWLPLDKQTNKRTDTLHHDYNAIYEGIHVSTSLNFAHFVPKSEFVTVFLVYTNQPNDPDLHLVLAATFAVWLCFMRLSFITSSVSYDSSVYVLNRALVHKYVAR